MNSKGAISIFLVIIMLGSIFFGGFFIDASRILIAERKTQTVLNSAARSVMAGYDQNLVGEYGIYAIKKGSNDEFKRYLETNLKERHEGIRFIDYRVENSSISGVEELLGGNSLNEQIMEYMKYKGPVIITVRVIDKFKKAFSPSVKKVYSAADSTKMAYDAANKSVKSLSGSLKRYVTSEFKKQTEDIKRCAVEDIIGIVNTTITQSDNIVNQMTDATKNINEYGTTIGEANIEIQEAVNTENKDVDLEQKINFDEIKLKNSFETSENQISIKDQILKEKENVNINIQVLNAFRDKVEPKVNRIISCKNSIESLEDSIAAEAQQEEPNENVIGAYRKQIASYRDEINKITGEINNLRNSLKFTAIGSVAFFADPTDVTVELDKNSPGKFEALKKKLEDSKAKIEGFVDSLKPLPAGWVVDPKDLIKANENEKAEMDKLRETDKFSLASSTKKINELTTQFDRISSFINNGITAMAENVYQTEYIMDKFTYVTSTTERDHYMQRGEVEYIIFGFDSPVANMVAGVGSVFTIRFTINAFTEFLTSKIPEFWSRLIAALAMGLAQSIEDMATLLGGENGETGLVPVCRRFPKIQVSYSDHLRLGLLLQDKKLERIENLMQVNIINTENEKKDGDKEFELSNYNTSVSAEVTTSINLLFLPAFGVDKMGFANIKDGRYILPTKKIYLSY